MLSERNPRIEIEYCTGCRWMLRASWVAQELLSTFEGQLGEVALQPSAVPGTFQVRYGSELIWCRKRDQGFAEIKEIKRRVRDKLDPQIDLGHLDR
ncbi:SelT/SelW/SelH family protein [Marinobacterium rhizophilum]|uniref:SelT/SelW/SelH family protein n=1 Tax=Marinobacterium rhizophilum TaxID=420402 RepID=UPI0003659803|nr:SelT/SelW/SelH family protein [Marinobacterium rhizophilum]